MEEALQFKTTTQRIRLSTTGPGNHRPDGPKASHALTFNLDNSGGADWCRSRVLIEAVTVHITAESIMLELEGALAAMVVLAQGGTAKSPLGSGLDASSVLVVAGAGFEPATFRL